MFQFACDIKAEVVGKPSKIFFQTAVNDIGAKPEKVSFAILDDISTCEYSDVLKTK